MIYDSFNRLYAYIYSIIISLLDKMLNDLSDGIYPLAKKIVLINLDTEEIYTPDTLLASTTIRNGTKLLLITQ